MHNLQVILKEISYPSPSLSRTRSKGIALSSKMFEYDVTIALKAMVSKMKKMNQNYCKAIIGMQLCYLTGINSRSKFMSKTYYKTISYQWNDSNFIIDYETIIFIQNMPKLIMVIYDYLK